VRPPTHSPPRVTQARPYAVALHPAGGGTTHHSLAATPIARVGPSSARRHDPGRAFRNAVSVFVVVVNNKYPRGSLRGLAWRAHPTTTPH
jgi:hypothetical protein